ncbi:organic solute transporter alpha-like protein 3 [Vespa velutina]|uniref:organic solute transporter alpha-like protein 3 n=1 Tax=Vespa velutina TaxID=202808 RepID=UPI001FB527BD|nr:organic solute transporter alpha-like protein 3 [Vespa velutina]
MEIFENRSNFDCDLDYVPSAIEHVESLGTFAIVLVCIGAIFSTMTLYLAIDATCNVLSQKETGLYKSNIISIFSIYPIASICSLIAIAMPRAQLLSEAVTQVFLTVSFYRLYLLLIDVGRRKITKAPSLMLKVGPCCCWPCLPFPNLDMIDSRLTWIRLIILQLPIIQGLLYFIMLIMALDEGYTLPTYSEWFQPFIVISILFALYGLTITTKSLHAVAPEAKLNFKTSVSQMVLMFSKAQAGIIRILTYTGIFPCRPPLSPKIYSNVTQNTLMLIEMLLLCVAARYLYYVDLEGKQNSLTTDRPKDKPHSMTNNKDLPEQVSTKIAIVYNS